MTTLTIRVNTDEKTIEPAFGMDFERIAVGEKVLLRIVGLPLSQEQANKKTDDMPDKPALRVRLRCGPEDVAVAPFPGEEPAWKLTAVTKTEAALCATIDLATTQAYAAFGGDSVQHGAARRMILYVERPVESGDPALYGTARIRVLPWQTRTQVGDSLCGGPPPFFRDIFAPPRSQGVVALPLARRESPHTETEANLNALRASMSIIEKAAVAARTNSESAAEAAGYAVEGAKKAAEAAQGGVATTLAAVATAVQGIDASADSMRNIASIRTVLLALVATLQGLAPQSQENPQ